MDPIWSHGFTPASCHSDPRPCFSSAWNSVEHGVLVLAESKAPAEHAGHSPWIGIDSDRHSWDFMSVQQFGGGGVVMTTTRTLKTHCEWFYPWICVPVRKLLIAHKYQQYPYWYPIATSGLHWRLHHCSSPVALGAGGLMEAPPARQSKSLGRIQRAMECGNESNHWITRDFLLRC